MKIRFIIAAILLELLLLCGCEENIGGENSTLDDTKMTDQQITSEVNEREEHESTVEVSEEAEKIDISSDAYIDLIKEIFNKAAQENGYFEYCGYDTYRYPYIQLHIAPKENYPDDVIKTQSTELIKNVLSDLKKYEYKSGSFFKYNYEYLNVYFYGYDEYGKYHRNGGPFIQINILNIQNATEEDLSF